ncbi:MAG TPA: NAD-dependent epimerase/dehydratase family protein [Acidimicrobiales bacterium]|nr:NAD-dependent epimerase/dehydratase family protein [Acidimicrobiales bacterium]
MNVTVTGGSGFIGSHVVDQMVAEGHDVTVIDTRPPHRADVTHCEVDITDLAGLVEATVGCDAVFHLAGVANVDEAMADPARTFALNVGGTANVWEAARHNEVGRAVLASTVWVYSATEADRPATEDLPIAVSSTGHVYTASKLAAELVATSYAQLYGLSYTILRYGIPFGPRMREELVIPRFLGRAHAGEPIVINGDGLQYRNYVYIEDMAHAHVLALDDKAGNQIFNLEGPDPVSIRRLAEVVRELVNPLMDIEFRDARPGDFVGHKASREKSEELLGWTARTTFEEGMRRYAEWWLEANQRVPSPGALGLL